MLLYCDRYFKGQTIALPLNILQFCELSRDWKKAGNTSSICVVKHSTLHTFMTSASSCLPRSNFIEVLLVIEYLNINNCDVKYFNENITQYFIFSVAVLICSHSSYIFQFYWHIYWKSTADFFDPPSIHTSCWVTRTVARSLCDNREQTTRRNKNSAATDAFLCSRWVLCAFRARTEHVVACP